MYGNYGGPPGYGRPPGYGGSPPGMTPPGIGPPPANSAPGAPGVAPPAPLSAAPVLGGPRPLPPNWQPPANMPNINFNAPVIRLGTSGPMRGGDLNGPLSGRRDNASGPSRRGLGDSSMRDGDGKGREPMQQLIPPTREEIARTIFVSNIPPGLGDNDLERILRSAGALRKWMRCTDAHNKPQTFGFAEYEDAEGLETAAAVFKEVQVPTKRQDPNKEKKEGEEEEEVEKTTLKVMVDDNSIKYAEEWRKRRRDTDEAVQFRVDKANEELSSVLASLFNPPAVQTWDHDADAVVAPAETQEMGGVEVVNIAFSAEDELADIPDDMREVVAAEIAAFRDRSNRRDQERLRREEEIEAEERRRSGRRASPPASAPTGPGGAGVNGVPLGPRADRGIQGAPSGPKGSREYQSSMNFVNGSSMIGGSYISREDDDDSASDEELERRRKKKIDEQKEEEFREKLSVWLKTEARTAGSMERISERMKNEERERARAREAQRRYLENFDDDDPDTRAKNSFYHNRDAWVRERERAREIEAKADAADRAQEQRELAAEQKNKEVARGLADEFLNQQAEELSRPQRQAAQPFKLNLGAAAKKIEEAAAPVPRRTAVDVENLLEDEELPEIAPTKKRQLIPINFDAKIRNNLTAEEVEEERKQLAREIPSDKEGLWQWKISWEHLPTKAIDVDIKTWVEQKILDIMGMQEDMLVDTIVEHLKSKNDPQLLIDNLQLALDDEAEGLVKKLWRMVIYYSEMEKRGIK